MKILYDENLAKYTTLKIGGIASKMYFPENNDDLLDILKNENEKEYYIIAGGSNLLINDEKKFDCIINISQLNKEIKNLGDGFFYCGASVRIQQFINTAKDLGYGGCEYLYSLPAMMSGIICMNAGRGEKYHCSIADRIVEIYALKNGEVITLTKEQCEFSYRGSIFQNGEYIILGAKLLMISQSVETTQGKIDERLELCKNTQDHSGSTFGSVFKTCNWKIMNWLRRLSFRSKGVRWSHARINWLISDKRGTYRQAKKCIDNCIFWHKLLKKDCSLEVVIWS